jgi:hypothetical protein
MSAALTSPTSRLANLDTFPRSSFQIPETDIFTFQLPLVPSKLPKQAGDLFTIKSLLENHLKKMKINKIERLPNEQGIRIHVAGIGRKIV